MKSFRFLGRLAALCALAASLVSAVPAMAAPGVAVDITARANGTYSGSNALGTPVFPFDVKTLVQLSAGTGSGQADKMFSDQRTISASSSENLDLAGVLTGPLGSTLTFGHVKAILIIADPGNTNNVCVGGAASNTFVGPFADATDIICLPPGAPLLVTNVATGWAVTASTGDLLKVANSSSGTSVTYKVLIIGTST